MIAAVLLQLAVAVPANSGQYATLALRELVSEAAEENRRVPRSLDGYRAGLESEISLVIHRSDGLEILGQVEQLHGTASWKRTGAYEQHISGYRLQAAGPSLSALTYLHDAWTVPVLYGNRMALFFGVDSAARERRRARGDTVTVIHPFAPDRDTAYQFSGGDTIVTLRVAGRVIPIVKVLVRPRPDFHGDAVLFNGEIDVDAVRKQIVRLRGFFVRVGHRASVFARLGEAALTGVVFVELVNEQVDERYWLPSYQRIEAQVSSVLTGDNRSIVRMISRFRGFDVASTADTARDIAPGDTLRPLEHRLTVATRDSLEAFRDWGDPVGGLSDDARAEDFDDVAPDPWRPTGAPSFTLRPRRFSDLFRFNRVEGAFTGYGADFRLRDAAPGLALSAAAGWAWAEGAWRGGAGASWTHGSWRLGLDASRALASTNDFTPTADLGATFPALLGIGDDYDYLDRRSVTLTVRRSFLALGGGSLTLNAGPASDRAVTTHVSRGIVRADSAFRAVRGIAGGRYAGAAAVFSWRPTIYEDLLLSGAGGRLNWTGGWGSLRWQRVEGEFVLREWFRDWRFATRLNAGVVGGRNLPPQQLFEVGSTQELSGFGYKEFAGDRAVVARASLVRALPVFRAPIRLGGLVLPGPWPALGIGAQCGWAEAGTPAARAALAELGEFPDPVTGAPTSVSVSATRPHTTADLRAELFGGAVRLSYARPIERGRRWTWVVGFGRDF